MRFTRPPQYAERSPGLPAGGSLGNYRQAPRKAPAWKRAYIKGLPAYALLECGHKENLNDGGVLIFVQNKRIIVLCDRCHKPAAVSRSVGFLEYLNITAKPIPDTPPY